MSLWCDGSVNDVISTGEMPSKNMRCSRVFSGIFPVEMASSQYRDTKAIFYLFYKLTKVFSSCRDVICFSILGENEIRPFTAFVWDACYFIN